MSDQSVETERETSAAVTHRKKEIGLPLAALGLALIPVLLPFFVLPFELPLPRTLILGTALLSPAAGLVLGIVALCRGKERIGGVGKTLAVIAVALPVSMAVVVGALFMTLTAVSQTGGM